MIKAVLILAVIGSAFSQRQSTAYKALPADGAAVQSASVPGAASGLAAARYAAEHAGRHTGQHAVRSTVGRPAGRHLASPAGRPVPGLTGGQAGVQSGHTNIFMRMLNNPFRLCRETENMRAIPCTGNNICNMVSMMEYRMPNMLTCSPMGIGCCLKDHMALQMSKLL